ncbi:MAG TPA: MurR/RpiR family transcriptional regulator [Xanthobacteraceae bacterium]|jgi:DNA-binding MurR/RpiR family transcriptional regulator|nr:MurR/RpiR family transcriptional regulator [Xanthobacteraceae bacterium]
MQYLLQGPVGMEKMRGAVDLFGERLRSRDRSLSRAELRVAKFIDQNRAMALACSAAQLAAEVGISDATVVRTAQALGFDGLSGLRRALATALEQRSSPADDMRRTLADVGENTGRAIDLVLDTHREAIEALQCESTRATILAAVSQLHRAERIVVFGIGPSAPLARYMTILLTRNGRPARTLDATGVALADQLIALREGDALLILAYGRAYREVVATFAEARQLRLPTVLVTDSLDGKLARKAEVVIPAKRGRANRVALHGTTLVVLEAIVLGLAASDRKRAMDALRRLNDLRAEVTGMRVDLA